MQETWKAVQGYEGLYEVSDLGRVRSLNYNHTGEIRILKPLNHRGGYLHLGLRKNKKKKYFSLHRLVALAFVEGYDLFNNQVNHINEDKTDNRAVNLEWVSAKENCNHGTRNERMSKTKSISLVQLTLDYRFITKWPSLMEVVRQCGFNQGNINSCCKHKPKHKTAHGYRWFYLSEYEEICFKVITSQHPFRLALPYRA